MVATIERGALVGKNTLENSIASLVGYREQLSTTAPISKNSTRSDEKGDDDSSEANIDSEDYVCAMVDGLTLKWTKRREDREWNRVAATECERNSDAFSGLRRGTQGQPAPKHSKQKAKKNAAKNAREFGEDTNSADVCASPTSHQTRLIVPGWHRALRNMIITSQKDIPQALSHSPTASNQVTGTSKSNISSESPAPALSIPLPTSALPQALSLPPPKVLLDPRKLVVYDFD